MELHGRKIIVTGAASGIGKELIAKLLAYDVTIVAADLRAEGCPSIPERVFPFRCDVSKPKEVDQLFAFAEQTLGGVDLFFANAGFAYYETLGPPDWAHIAQIFQTNVFAAMYSLEKMRAANAGGPFRLVVTASAMAYLPLPGYALYSATKAALSAFAEAHRFERGDPAEITLVYPIATRTEFFGEGDHQAPVPWPAQEAGQVARAILRGIERDKTHIFPSVLWRLFMHLYRLMPWLGRIYQRAQLLSFRRWEENLATAPPKADAPPAGRRPLRAEPPAVSPRAIPRPRASAKHKTPHPTRAHRPRRSGTER